MSKEPMKQELLDDYKTTVISANTNASFYIVLAIMLVYILLKMLAFTHKQDSIHSTEIEYLRTLGLTEKIRR